MALPRPKCPEYLLPASFLPKLLSISAPPEFFRIPSKPTAAPAVTNG